MALPSLLGLGLGGTCQHTPTVPQLCSSDMMFGLRLSEGRGRVFSEEHVSSHLSRFLWIPQPHRGTFVGGWVPRC